MEHRDVLRALFSSIACAPSICVALWLSLYLALWACSQPTPTDPKSPELSGVVFGQAQIERVSEMGFPGPLSPDETNHVCDDLRAANLGHILFFDKRLSVHGDISCATCHQPDRGFTDGLALNVGISRGVRNTLTILDAAHQTWFNWDGRFDSLWSQAHGPISHPREMGASFDQVVNAIRGDAKICSQYEAIFGQFPATPLTPFHVEQAVSNLGKALAAYERRLMAGPSAFDRWVDRWRDLRMTRELDRVPAGDFSASAQRGLDLFTSRALCWKCHAGPLLSDGEFHALGAAPRNDLISDPGRFGAVDKLLASPFRTGGPHSDSPRVERAQIVESLVAQPDQWGAFRTPSLRNLGLTAPYFHQGQFATLEEVLRFYSTLDGAVTMDHHRELVLKRRDFSEQELLDLEAFLRSLDGAPPPSQWTRDPALSPPQQLPPVAVPTEKPHD